MPNYCQTIWEAYNTVAAAELPAKEAIEKASRSGRGFDIAKEKLQEMALALDTLENVWNGSFYTLEDGKKVFGPNYDAWLKFCVANGVNTSDATKLLTTNTMPPVEINEYGMIVNVDLMFRPWAKDIIALSHLRELTGLDLNDSITTDLSILKNFPLLKILITPKEVKDLNYLSELKGLERLVIENAQVSDLEPLSNLKNLVFINARSLSEGKRSTLVNIDSLYSHAELQELDFSFSLITSVASLSTAVNLKELDIRYTSVKDLSPLAGLDQLKKLSMDSSQIQDISALESMSGLEKVYMRNIPATKNDSSREIVEKLRGRGVDVLV